MTLAIACGPITCPCREVLWAWRGLPQPDVSPVITAKLSNLSSVGIVVIQDAAQALAALNIVDVTKAARLRVRRCRGASECLVEKGGI
jgi:hypothetical protein